MTYTMTLSVTSAVGVMIFTASCPRYLLWWPASTLRCTACDKVGHLAANCPHFHGAPRDPTNPDTAVQQFMGGEYTVILLGRTAEDERVIEIKNPDNTKREYVVKRATGDGCNCLIDTLRQTIQAPEGIPLYDGYLNLVRLDLVRAYKIGDTRVRFNTS